MKKNTIITSMVCVITGLLTSGNAQSLAFRQGSFQINVTEGSTYANYITQNDIAGTTEGQHIIGCRDPLQLEYGLTNHWGIGLSSGADIYNINPGNLYGFTVSNNQVKVTTTEFTLDANYHFFVTRVTDISAVLSYGSSTASFKGNDGGDNAYSYAASGNIIRAGIHGHFFVLGHFGLTAMFTAFSEASNPQVPKNYTGTRYSTVITGFAKEFGICYRIKK